MNRAAFVLQEAWTRETNLMRREGKLDINLLIELTNRVTNRMNEQAKGEYELLTEIGRVSDRAIELTNVELQTLAQQDAQNREVEAARQNILQGLAEPSEAK